MKFLYYIFSLSFFFLTCNISDTKDPNTKKPNPPLEETKDFAPDSNSKEASMLEALDGWEAYPILTVGEKVNNYYFPGALDGMGVYESGNELKVLVNHELGHDEGYVFNGIFSGSRISSFNLNTKTLKTSNAKIAFNSVIDRNEKVITNLSQIYDSTSKGFDSFCSGGFFKAGTFNLTDDIYVTGEEWDNGQFVILDVNSNTLNVAPALGRGAWENLTFVETGYDNKVAALLSDDRNEAPMYLYVGTKNNAGDFLDRNGLKNGKLYVWKADSGLNYNQFKGNGTVKNGKFVEINYKGTNNTRNFDQLGYLKTRNLQMQEVKAKKGFIFSRPEDIHTNPKNKKQVVFTNTGIESSNFYGTITTMELNFSDLNNIKAEAKIIYDANVTKENGIRNPDNLVWADNGDIYVNEDPTTAAFSSSPPSVWKLTTAGVATRIAKIKKVIPKDQKYNGTSNWETSGVLDVSKYYSSGTWLLVNVQAHGVDGGSIKTNNLAEGSQMLLLRKK